MLNDSEASSSTLLVRFAFLRRFFTIVQNDRTILFHKVRCRSSKIYHSITFIKRIAL